MPFGGLLTGGILGLVGSFGSAAMGSSAAQNAAKTQSAAAIQAAQIQAGTAQQALNFQKQVYNQGQVNQAPWLSSGTSALANLDYLLGINGPGQVGGAPPGGPGGPETGVLPNRTANAPGSAAPGGTTLNPGGVRPIGGPIMGQGDTLNLSALNRGPGSPATGAPAGPGADLSQFAGQTFNSLVGSGNPVVSPDQATTQGWQQQGIPFQNITTSDGRTVSIRTDNPAALNPPPPGYTPPSDLNSLVNPSLGARGSLMQSYPGGPFVAPTGVTEQNDPGYQFRLQQGQQALQQSAAARGGLLTGGTARDLTQFGQDYASNEYGNVYNRALGQYQQNYNIFQQEQANRFNRLAALSGMGQTTAGQLNSAGQGAAGNVGNILLTSGAQQGQQLSNAAAATASGYIGSANAYGGALGNLGNFGQLASLYSLLGKGGQGSVDLSGIPVGGAVPGLGGYNPYGG